RADAVVVLLLARGGWLGALTRPPGTPRAGETAHRVRVPGRRDARTPLVLLPPIILQNATGGPSAEAEAVLRHGAALAFA
ncbi:MAG: methyltransferase, partial [Pseudomonadota bacterium]|nr:methyltransferase [Pseudomonadota bacterium]